VHTQQDYTQLLIMQNNATASLYDIQTTRIIEPVQCTLTVQHTDRHIS